MDARQMVQYSLNQSQSYLKRALEGLTQEDVSWAPADDSNNIAFIIWHMARVEDYFFTRVIQRRAEVYEEGGWAEKLGTPARETGFGYTPEQLAAWPVPKLQTLVKYTDAVRESTLALLENLTPEKMLEAVRPDRSPDTVGQLLARVSTELALHIGQIDYIAGMKRGAIKTEAPQY